MYLKKAAAHSSSTTSMLTICHLLVDGLCACCLFMFMHHVEHSDAWTLFLLYNSIAFLTQPITGLWIDKMHRTRLSYTFSISLLLISTILTFLCISAPKAESYILEVICVIMLGLGNSFFHVFGGKHVTDSTNNDIRALGVFVSTGALGITIGQQYCSNTLLLIFILLILIISYFIYKGDLTYPDAPSHPIIPTTTNLNLISSCRQQDKSISSISNGVVFFLIVMLAIVFARSFMSKVIPVIDKSFVSNITTLSIVAMAGKAAGGYVAKKYGEGRTLFFSLWLSVLLFLFCKFHPIFVCGTMFCVSISMPITLSLSNKATPHHSGFIFGILAAALLPGYLLGSMCSTPLCHLLLMSLLATLVIEGLILFYMKERRINVYFIFLVMNVLTNVPLNIYVLYNHPSISTILVLELIVIVVESLLYYITTRQWKRSFAYGFVCNVTSYIGGLALGQLFIWLK